MYFPDKDELIRQINNLKRKHKIGQEEIATISGIPQSTISNIIGKNVKRRPRDMTYEQAQKIYNALLQLISPFSDGPVSRIATESDKVDSLGAVHSEATVSEVARIMDKQGFTQLVVKNDNGDVEGMITDFALLSQMLSPKDIDRDWLKELKNKPIKTFIEKPSIIPKQTSQAEVAQAYDLPLCCSY